MKIRTKVIALLAGLFAILGIAQYVVAQRIFLPSFSDLELQAAQTDMDRAAFTVNRELELLAAMTADWGNWDAVYAYMRNRNPAFIKANITPSSIATYRANAVAFIGLDGKFLWSSSVDYQSGAPLDIDLMRPGAIPRRPVWQQALSRGTALRGLVRTNLGPMMFALAPVLNGDGKGPHRGMVLIGRLLNGAEVTRIGLQAQVQLALQTLGAGTAVGNSDGWQVRDDMTEVHRQLRNVSGRPLADLRVDVPRHITRRGTQVVRFAAIFLSAAAIAALLLVVLILDRLVLNPLDQVTRHVVNVGRNDDLTAQLGLERRDELGDLAREFDAMVTTLAAARHQLVEHAFDSGIAENASGVLHNIGNAVTPLGVNVAVMQRALAAAPTQDLQLALAELARSDLDAARKEDVGDFLRLAAGDLLEVVSTARQTTTVLARQVSAIDQALAQQTRHSRTPQVLESLRLPELIQHSLDLVSPALRARLDIQMDDSLQAAGPLRLARATLQQVIQNLVVNAAEATDASGCGTLQIAASILQQGGERALELRVADNGSGVAAENLPRIFAKGFSTKSHSTNSGIGLHWCANAVHALGGRIRVHSPGSGCGATFVISLPIEASAPSTVRSAA